MSLVVYTGRLCLIGRTALFSLFVGDLIASRCLAGNTLVLLPDSTQRGKEIIIHCYIKACQCTTKVCLRLTLLLLLLLGVL